MAREYFYTIDQQGRLLHDATELSDPGFLDFFYTRLKPNDTGLHPEFPFLSPCGGELNFVRTTGQGPIVFQKKQDGRLYYAPGLSVVFEPGKLRIAGKPGATTGSTGTSSVDALIHPAPVGTWGSFRKDVTLELGQAIESFGPYFAYREVREDSRDRLHVIEPLESDPNIDVFRPEAEAVCFGCGAGNNPGIALPFLFFKDSGEARSWFTPPIWMAGHPQFMHGGFISLLLDEVMAKALRGHGLKGFTANLNVDFKSPCKIGTVLELKAVMVRQERRKIFLQGEILNDQGAVLARSEGLFVVT
ncbi:MAG: DUF4505 family protein [Spirochaetia bacterium]|nr:DUF4505 family protein [Spirochaetia bacterium]